MAMTFNNRVLENGARHFILQVNGVETATTVGGTQDGSATGIIAAAGYTPTAHLKVRRINYSTFNCVLNLQWHATSNVNLAAVAGAGDIRMNDNLGAAAMGIWDDGAAGVTGDIDIFTTPLTSVTAASGGVTASVTAILFCIKGV